MELILSDRYGSEIRVIRDCNADFDIGDTNDFQLTFDRSAWTGDITDGCMVYVPGTEYGGIVRRIKSNTKDNQINVGGYTWRGRLDKQIVEPPAGQAYRYVTGELNAVINELIGDRFGGLIRAVNAQTGVHVTNFRINRYVTLLEAIKAVLSSVGYRAEIKYSNIEKCCYVGAVPVLDYSSTIELSDDSKLEFIASETKDGVNHLICLGIGELTERLVVHLYVQSDGSIGRTKYYTGMDEIAETYDYNQADEDALIDSGSERLRSLADSSDFRMDVSNINVNVDIGDVIGGRDYITGKYTKAEVTNKIYTVKNGFESVNYKIGGN